MPTVRREDKVAETCLPGSTINRVGFRLLGPVELVVDGESVPVGGAGVRCLLAALVTEPGQVVSAERITEVLWAGRPPATARTIVQGYVSGCANSSPSWRCLCPWTLGRPATCSGWIPI